MAHHHHHDNHGQGHGHDHDHGHDHEEETSGSNLYSKIDISNVTVLNSPHPASNVIKPWNSRLNDLVRS
jgi:ABC-type Zn2+ transport system substrate-binding protein/surface adhesin